MCDPPSVLYLSDRGTSMAMARDRQGVTREHREGEMLGDKELRVTLVAGPGYCQRFINYRIQCRQFPHSR